MTFWPDPEESEVKALHAAASFSGARVLEVGCGDGRLMYRYAAATSSVVGFDPDAASLATAVRDCPSDLSGKIRAMQCAAERLPFRKHTFDIALLGWSL